MKRRLPLILFILFGVGFIGMLAFLAFFRPARAANAQFTNLSTVRAMWVDYLDEDNSRDQVAALETNMQQARVTLVALGAGRVDWTYFPWRAYPDRWSAEVKSTGQDYLLEDSTRFGKWAHVSAVVDVLAPLYIQSNPQSAAVSWTGTPSKYLVSTTDLVDGQFGQEILSMLDEIATDYPINSITLTELTYYTDGFGDSDKAAYLTYTGRLDWPLNPDGTINIDEPSIGAWRSFEIGRFLEKAARILHQHGEQLFVEAHLSLDPSGQVRVENGTDFSLFLKYADRLVVRTSSDPAERSQAGMQAITQYLKRFPENRMITCIGLWSQDYDADTPKDRMSAFSVANFQSELQEVGGDVWITPSFLMTPAHWQALQYFWGSHSN
jgi:hypothetical protein